MISDFGASGAATERFRRVRRALGREAVPPHGDGHRDVLLDIGTHKWVAVPLGDSVAPWRAVLRALPADVPHAIEYPLVGDDLEAVVRTQIDFIRAARA